MLTELRTGGGAIKKGGKIDNNKTTTNYTTNNNIKRTKDKGAAGFMNINHVVWGRSK